MNYKVIILGLITGVTALIGITLIKERYFAAGFAIACVLVGQYFVGGEA